MKVRILWSIAALAAALGMAALIRHSSTSATGLPDGKARSHALREAREGREHRRAKAGQAGDESHDALARETEFAQARTAPGLVLPGAYGAAFASLSGLPATGGGWTEV